MNEFWHGTDAALGEPRLLYKGLDLHRNRIAR